MDYLEGEQEIVKTVIKGLYEKIKADIKEEDKKTPLREFTYDAKPFRMLIKKDGSMFLPNESIIFHIDDYIHKYHIKLDKDITLEEAINLI